METKRRKLDHIRICCTEDVEFRSQTTLLECVRLIHGALPEISLADIELERRFMGRRISAPIMIGAITGGVEQASKINRDLARAAAELGIGMQLGSQRAMLEAPSLAETYAVRDAAPDILLLGNIGVGQARELDEKRIKSLVDDIAADGICLHLNPAMEIFQSEGDRDFRDGLETIKRFAGIFGDRLIVKETGCGISRETAERLIEIGVGIIDIGGAGGSSWVRIEQLRCAGRDSSLAEWGIPAAASLCELRDLPCVKIASGGMRDGLDFARSFALGASFGACALPFLRAQQQGGQAGAAEYGRKLIDELRAVCVLTGSKTITQLGRAPKVITGLLREWIAQRCPDTLSSRPAANNSRGGGVS